MKLKKLDFDLTVCQTASAADVDFSRDFYFAAKTDDEFSLVCRTADTPADAIRREDGWRGFRIEGTLDFSLIGILAELCAVLAKNRIGIFAVSTYNTDYILVKREHFGRAIEALENAGHTIVP